MNLVVLVGRLTKDVKMTYFEQNGEQKPIANYTLAVDSGFKKGGNSETDFIPCKAFGKNADFASNYLAKGTKIIIRGHIKTGSYTNKDGKKVYTQDVLVDTQEFAESKSANTGGNTYPSDDLPPMGSGGQPSDMPSPPPAPNDSFMNIPSDIQTELPFR